MRSAIPGLFLLLLASTQEKTGTLEIEIVPPPGEEPGRARIILYDLGDDFAWAKYMKQAMETGPCDPPEERRITPASSLQEANLVLSVPPGTYHVKIDFPGIPPRWFLSPPVRAEETATLKAPFPAQGSIRGRWSLDKGPCDREGKSLEPSGGEAQIRLVENGILIAATTAKMNEDFIFPDVPPGNYAIVLSGSTDAFLWVLPRVRVSPGKEARIQAKVRRGGLGGTLFQANNGKTGDAINIATGFRGVFLLMDDKRCFVLKPSVAEVSPQKKIYAAGFKDAPTGTSYKLLLHAPGFRPLTKKGVRVTPVKVKKASRTMRLGQFVYPKGTVTLSPE